MSWPLSPHIDLGNERITEADARRQRLTAEEILRRLEHQPGVILADEVGMGKTFVALAVAVSVIEATRRQVLVLVPPSVQHKWPKEWKVFAETCLSERLRRRLRGAPQTVNSGTDLLRQLDDDKRTRFHLLFATHGAFDRTLTDPWLQLALVYRAFYKRPSLSRFRPAFAHAAGSVIGNSPAFRDPTLVTSLLSSPLQTWRGIVDRKLPGLLDDDPIPKHLLEPLKQLDPSPIVQALDDLPLKKSKYYDQRVKAVRHAIREVRNDLWRTVLTSMKLRLPLLVLDEAHHAKNPATRLAQQFRHADDTTPKGVLAGCFERMLFLTATPFQLGHAELIRVLDRFDGVSWSSVTERNDFARQRDELNAALDRSQAAALRLQQVWGRITADDIANAPERWWDAHDPAGLPDSLRRAIEALRPTRTEFRAAETLLRPWVIRHLRDATATTRQYRPGRQVLDPAAAPEGIEVTGDAVLPFLLAARAQGLAATQQATAAAGIRALFAEGLCSSFEAYRETRTNDTRALDDEATGSDTSSHTSPELDWYLGRIDRLLPKGNAEAGQHHPKIAATVQLAVDLWGQRQKLLVFCFYLATGRALRRHISQAIWRRTLELAATALDLDHTDPERVRQELERRANRFFDTSSALVKSTRCALEQLVQPARLDPDVATRVVDIALRFLRTPSFLSRYVPLTEDSFGDAVLAALHPSDDPGALASRIAGFSHHLASRTVGERDAILTALDELVTGVRPANDPYDEANPVGGVWVPDVRLANGSTQRQLRERLMLAFNAPFLPDVLVSSSVLGEGVDLHLDCRRVVHHDADWNPSVLEQRTGRIDRIGSLAARTKQPVVVYEPFLAGAHDEKQHRVVKDRKAWFTVVMGGPISFDEASTDQEAARVPLPDELVEQLRLDLSVAKPEPIAHTPEPR